MIQRTLNSTHLFQTSSYETHLSRICLIRSHRHPFLVGRLRKHTTRNYQSGSSLQRICLGLYLWNYFTSERYPERIGGRSSGTGKNGGEELKRIDSDRTCY